MIINPKSQAKSNQPPTKSKIQSKKIITRNMK